MGFYTRLKQLRAEKNLAAKDLAAKLNMSTNMIYEWEHGRCSPSIESLLKLSSIFEVSIDYILCNSDELGNITVSTGQLTDQLPNDEQRLLFAYRNLEKIDKDKLIDDAEYFARRSSQNSNLKNRA